MQSDKEVAMSPAQHDDLQALLAHASAAMRAAAIEVESMPDGEARDRCDHQARQAARKHGREAADLTAHGAHISSVPRASSAP